jgi:hypothetical protein
MSRATFASLLGVLLAAALIGACGQASPQPPPTPPDLTQPTPVDTDPEETMPSEPLQPPPGIPAELFAQIAQEAAALSGVAVDELEVERAAPVTWNDGSLGCPEPGQLYTQALVDGYWIVLRANGQELDFRATRDGHFRLCPPGQGRPPIDP